MKNNPKNIALRLAVLASLLTFAVPSALAHDVPCPVCGLKVVQGTKTQDNEVVLRYGKKKIEYRCAFCAISDAKRYEGDLIVYAPSETKGKPVLLRRTAGKWTVVKDEEGKLVPVEGAVFLNNFGSHAKCALLSRAFHTKAALEKYATANGLKDAKALTLDEMVAASTKN